jgi:hypothetical protein
MKRLRFVEMGHPVVLVIIPFPMNVLVRVAQVLCSQQRMVASFGFGK